jgi:outer membrane protein assembly factor BamB
VALPAIAGEWPHWRGPQMDGTSDETALPLAWSASENVIWKLELPEVSGSTPIVWGDRIFLSVAEGSDLSLWAVDRDAGEVVWKRRLDDRNERKRKGNLSSPSPVTDGSTVWAMTGTGVLAAFDFDGSELWRRDLQADYGAFGILHGYSSSPILLEDALIVQVLHGFNTDDPSYVLSIDQASGETRWRVERPTDAPREAPDAYTTPTLFRRGSNVEIVISGADYVTGHDPATGRELWRVAGLNPDKHPMYRVVASPIVVGDTIFAPSRVKPLLALRAGESAGSAPAKLWSFDKGPDVPSPVSDGERLYILRDNGVMWAFDAESGDVLWGPERVAEGDYSASPVLANGRIYVTNESGSTTVVAAKAEFDVLAENDLDEYTLSSIAISDGQLFLRTSKHLFAIGASE